ncbi:acyl-CoA dehydrogenase family protein [Cellulomonas citrea]|uniref:acyl-CoA dehydrogenase family protein n=1 Tax=Cellulomonas citrea TaxID=1909423 RepID=UPI00135A5498|nr:acyl-CoA dehydrogenase family protein [Cellulomonas citrea]
MSFYEQDHEDYRETVREYVRRYVSPSYDRWEADRLIDREVWRPAGEAGLIGLDVPEAYEGPDLHDWRFRMVVAEELNMAGAASLTIAFAVQDDLVLPYLIDLGTDEQKARWLPGMAAGELIGAIGMTEPGAGSDLQAIRTTAVRDGDDWVLNGQKTFISNGINADLVIVVAKTDPAAGARGISLLVVERGMPGFERGRKLDKLGLHAQDTAELFFTDVRVPATNVLGEIGHGFGYLMQRLPRERLSIAAGGYAGARAALQWTQDYVFERKAFGQRIGDFQNTRFELAEIETEIDVTRAYLEQCVLKLNAGTLTTVEASKAKWWATELEGRATTRLLQLFGGYGFMDEYPISRAFRDSRVQTIYGGTTEIMKEIIGRDIAARYR